MTKILILGHNGMLGNALFKFFNENKQYTVTTTKERWGDVSFNETLIESDSDIIINCIGAIPQKNKDESDYNTVNIDLPIFLEKLNKKIIHPSTDCEFSGNIELGMKYKKSDTRDANDSYGKSKADISRTIENEFKNTKVIRTSIIGHELNSHLALLDWFLSSQGTVKGFSNHYWNGITTLQWAKLAENLITNWDNFPIINQYGTSTNLSKFEVLNLAKKVYEKNIIIESFETPNIVNKCLQSDIEIPSLEVQLTELKAFYKK